MCDCKSIGDEFRYVLERSHFSTDRLFCKKTNTIKFNELMNSNNVVVFLKMIGRKF